MTIDIQAIHFSATAELRADVTKQIEKLSTFHDSILRTEVFLKLEKADDRKNKHAEIKLYAAGTQLFSSARDHSFEGATATAASILRRQLRKLKQKQTEATQNPPPPIEGSGGTE